MCIVYVNKSIVLIYYGKLLREKGPQLPLFKVISWMYYLIWSWNSKNSNKSNSTQ